MEKKLNEKDHQVKEYAYFQPQCDFWLKASVPALQERKPRSAALGNTSWIENIQIHFSTTLLVAVLFRVPGKAVTNLSSH